MTTIAVQCERLRTAAEIWGDCAKDVRGVHGDLQGAEGQGDKFGVLAGSSGVSGNYDVWIADMVLAARTGAKNFDFLCAALHATADDMDGVDSTVAASVAEVNEKLPDD